MNHMGKVSSLKMTKTHRCCSKDSRAIQACNDGDCAEQYERLLDLHEQQKEGEAPRRNGATAQLFSLVCVLLQLV